ncbi:MAG: hypothetical protein IKW01_04080 [Firmicutes bacterium]|nr:hypothetical protein [Bacillota bacterium]
MNSTKKILGPKFRPYFMLHLNCIKGDVIGGIVVGFVMGALGVDHDYTSVMFDLFLTACYSVQPCIKLCSNMLYQQEAYLYQSFPVSAFETAAAKTAAGALVPVAVLVTAVIKSYGAKGFFAAPVMMAGCLLVVGILLAAIGFGNTMRDSRAKKPSAIASTFAAVFMLGAQFGLTIAFVNWVAMVVGLKIMILTATFVAEAAGVLWYNTWNLKNNYQA